MLQPNEPFERLVLRPALRKMAGSASHRPCLAVHLRYGDSCSAFEQNRTARRCGPVAEYVEAAARLQSKYQLRSVVVASDSLRALREFERLWGGRTRVIADATRSEGLGDAFEARGTVFEKHQRAIWHGAIAAGIAAEGLGGQARGSSASSASSATTKQGRAPEGMPADRLEQGGVGTSPSRKAEGGGGPGGGPGVGGQDSEEHWRDGVRRACGEWQRVADFLVDLHALAGCDALVGKMTSNFDRLVLALMVARRGRTPPFASLDGSAWCSNAHSTWGASQHGAFPCRVDAAGDPPDEDSAMLHAVGQDGKAHMVLPPRRPDGSTPPPKPGAGSSPSRARMAAGKNSRAPTSKVL